MGWATAYIAKLKEGESVSFRPRGNSMRPTISSGQLCTVDPVDFSSLEVGDVVLCKVHGNQYLHNVRAIQGRRYQISNNKGRVNGWVGQNGIFGKLMKVED